MYGALYVLSVTGKEVAEYCSRRMPEMLQSNASYKSGDLPTALRKLFMETDGKLLEEDAVRELKRYVAGAKEGESDTEVQIDSRYCIYVLALVDCIVENSTCT